MYPTEISNNNLFSGIIIITDLNGNFINGYRVKNSKFITQFFLKSTNKNSKYLRISEIDCGCGNGEFCLVFAQNLNEITINANSSNLISPVNLWGLISNISSFVIINESPFWDWDGGGSPPPISPIDCETGYKDIYGNCVPKPCIGDSFVNMEISNFNSGKNANRFGCVRKDPNKICNNIIGDRYHAGIDLKAEIGTIIVSITDGQVYATGTSPTFGNYIIIKNDNLFFLYAHLYEVPVTNGAIKAGQQIAISGESATVGEPHLHLEVRERMANENYNDMKNLNIENYLKTKFDNNGNTINNNC